jgi:hypothetical protein
MGFLAQNQPSELGSAFPALDNPSFWQTASLEVLNPFAQPIWLPIPSSRTHIPSATPTPTYEVHPGLASQYNQGRSERSYSFASICSQSTCISSPELSPRTSSRASSPGQADLNVYGFMNPEGTWSCAYPGCTSRAVFIRGCDLRKHHKRHTKSFFCRYPGCTQASGGGFSSKKDLARHEAKHNPGVVCEWAGCERLFSRTDNMRDHVKRIHMKSHRSSAGKGGSR